VQVNEFSRATSDDGELLRLLARLEEELNVHWDFGRNLVLAWCLRGDAIDIIMFPHYDVGNVQRVRETKRSGAEGFFQNLVSGSKRLSVRSFENALKALEISAVRVQLPGLKALRGRRHFAKIEVLIQRYGVTFYEARAVALFDIVGFSKLTAFERLAQLNSLAYSCNAAQSKFKQHSSRFDFANSTTGDGFYVWNRDDGVNANIDLYSYVHLILADNALARQKAENRTAGAPLLKTAFHIASYYELFHANQLRPSKFNYIVGDATIELARIVEKAVPGQILIGDFDSAGCESVGSASMNALSFIEKVQPRTSKLRGLKLSGQQVEQIRCYLTGPQRPGGGYSIRQFRITDKHGYQRTVYNAKLNIHRLQAPPIFLGLMDSSLSKFERQSNVEAVGIVDAGAASIGR